ncbi:MAG: long-chain-fatty-acid--CoA ligase [Betaproteobacteria bacterium]|jgi:fatty-acyl-CoA synthase|nr:AMP-binding protein [Rhodocyclaceae bacterium]MCE2899561.1 AMP-binding protein [Betaproteobacteria bacterium]
MSAPKHWPKQFSWHLTVPETSLWANLEVSASRYPGKAATVFYDTRTSYAALAREAAALAGHLQKACGVARGDRVLLDLQNCPQFIVASYAIARADAVVVPVTPMHVTDELAYACADSGARVAIVGAEVVERVLPLLGTALDHVIAVTYSDALGSGTSLQVPAFVRTPRAPAPDPRVIAWHAALEAVHTPRPHTAGPDDLAAILYTSGTTGRPKGCMHTHRTIQTTAVGGALFENVTQDAVILSTAPLFHVTGMQHSMHAGVYAGATIALLPRWDASAAGYLIERYGCSHWANVPTMVVDLLAHPDTTSRDLSSLRNVFGGGSSMPAAVAAELQRRCGIQYMEGYGMTEAISQTHINPPHMLRRQSLGIPTFDTLSFVVDPQTLRKLPPGEVGEIVVSGPQLMKGYWNRPEATAEAFVDIDGRRFYRTGDLGRMDEEGFFTIADRLKRMINAAGYKVWPAELEGVLYQHPAIHEVAIISAPDERRGETVKACVVLKQPGAVDAAALIAWCREHMAAYKVPRRVQFMESLPRSGTGKIQWRSLQEQEWQAAAGGAAGTASG